MRVVVGILGRQLDELTAAIERAISALETNPEDHQVVIDGLREALCPPLSPAPSNPTQTSSKPNPST